MRFPFLPSLIALVIPIVPLKAESPDLDLSALDEISEESYNTLCELSVLDFILGTEAPGWEIKPEFNPGKVITSGFGYRESFGRMHYGIDFGMCVGDTVRCPLSGTVKRVGAERGGYGRFVIITHDDGLETRYAHLLRPLVAPGDRIAEGHAIALSGNSGNSTGPHLHFETRWCGLPVDPRNFFHLTQNSFLSATP